MSSPSDSTMSIIDPPPASASSSFHQVPRYAAHSSDSDDRDDDVDSLPSTTTSDSDSDSGYSDAEQEWRESLQQLELLLSMVVVPYFGKYMGRKAAYWGWAKFMTWKYPVDVVVTSKGVARAAGAVGVLASL